MATPQFKVYNAEGVYMAACKEPEAAAALVAFYGDGSTIRFGHRLIVWTEGGDGNAAVFSYESVVEMIAGRIQRDQEKRTDPVSRIEKRLTRLFTPT